ncbi:MAG: gamma-glutamyltransferase [Deltaproteobacteria bacterium]|nr:MAG: gamma-glutamyltransferase [Deltaproteobacteria bacterium]
MSRALLAFAAAVLGAAPVARAGAGAVATEHPLAAAAGAEMLRAGGTVVDAAVAAAAAVCVVHASSCGLGGGGFALVHRDDGRDLALDYREEAPAAATPERFLTGGRPDEALARSGGLAVGVPGEAAGLVTLHRRFGRLPLARVLAPAIRLAGDGFPLAEAPHLRREIERSVDLLRADPGLRAVFLGADGAPPPADFRVRQPDLAATLERLGRRGAAALARGSAAAAIAGAVRERGGVLARADLAGYRPAWRRPLAGTFHGHRVVTFPPPGSGGVLLEMLGILARDDLAALGAGSATLLHLLAGGMAQGFADRARWYGDPAFGPVPVAALLAPPRLGRLRAGLSAVRVVEPRAELASEHGTAHVSVVDAAGNAAAITTTINTAFGAGIMVPGTGIILNNEMDDFALAPGVPNAFGLVGAAANALAPRKRPQSSMSPTVVLAGRRPALVAGGSGGPTIISGILQVLLGVVAFGRPLEAAVAAPRIHDQAVPPVLAVEPGVAPEVRAVLERLGHRVIEMPAIGAVAAAGLMPAGEPAAAGDPRKDGGAAVVRD